MPLTSTSIDIHWCYGNFDPKLRSFRVKWRCRSCSVSPRIWSSLVQVFCRKNMPRLGNICVGSKSFPFHHVSRGTCPCESNHFPISADEFCHISFLAFRFPWKNTAKIPYWLISPSANITTENMSWWWYLSEKLSDDIIQDLKISSS